MSKNTCDISPAHSQNLKYIWTNRLTCIDHVAWPSAVSFEAYLMLPPSAFNSQCETNAYKALLVDHIVSVFEPHEIYFYMSILKA